MEIKEQFGSWYSILKPFIESDKFKNIARMVNADRKEHIVIPEKGSDVFFRVFRVTDYNSLRIVILGQDPYSNPENAYDGLAFSNSKLLRPQPSLKNILKEIEDSIYYGFQLNQDLDLLRWAEQGVFLINTAMSVRKGEPNSHLKIWKPFTLTVIDAINQKDDIIWMLWGNKAQEYEQYITNKSHTVVKSGHPSPLNTTNPFIGCNCFKQANKVLEKLNKGYITW